MKAGDKAKLLKKTFIQNGIFIISGSVVEIAEILDEEIRVMYSDKEGYPHVVTGLKEADLAVI
ncbi:MAG TPA: hypothetical protein PL048_04525 [Leptospiraceae bacterium]|nr:hypothetical protein [Leptospiraceae bacterium]HMY68523.1 hypothetical protein [Leptospiraceae bacterium]HMZ58014.1 hypothetical protein [Leptospiraceae bacterium]HNF14969.1 hypothetical protein [Leptospiraceae bacterium]HNF24353.1 hypothetical protein [Leptospiraceae bacterium]